MKYEICSHDVKKKKLLILVVCLASQRHWDSSLGLIWDKPELNKTKHMIRLTKAAFLQSEGESNKSEMSCFYSLRKILTVKKRLIFFFFFFFNRSGYCSSFRTSEAVWYCIFWWRNIHVDFYGNILCFNKCLWICTLILALTNEGMWLILMFSDRI